MGLSIRAYARHRGVSHVAVKKAIDTERGCHLPRDTRGPVQPRVALDARKFEHVGHGLRPIHQFLLAVRQLHLIELGFEHFVDGACL